MLNNKKKLQEYFKLAAYKIFKIIYGKVKEKTSHLDNDEINFHEVIIDKSSYAVYVCNNCSFYTDRIHDTALINNSKIVDTSSR